MGAAQNQPVPPATEQPSFTPRQWHYGEPVASHRKPFVYDQNGNLVANFSGWVGRTYEENVANAKLGAAAPDLYESAREWAKFFEDRIALHMANGDAALAEMIVRNHGDRIARLNAALAKAGVA
jgi:hypothetical protein